MPQDCRLRGCFGGVRLDWAKKEESGGTMTELKPCPFCGADGDSIQHKQYFLPYCPNVGVHVISIIYCDKCGGAMIDQNKKHCYNDTAKMWNRRVNE